MHCLIQMPIYLFTPFLATTFYMNSESLLEPFSIYSLIGELVITQRFYRSCLLLMLYKVIPEDLIELDIIDFDVIHWMDWVHASYASKDYRTHKVKS